ncbi:MAG: RpiB/LacA/LacB family sugar-phosphate isomerase [Candidatus Niyogibacteria bacterium]|nr:RpiB/LacA/LacB family sugar-phosphate isomerase [Candidatus Niyogibacteria bacterium]
MFVHLAADHAGFDLKEKLKIYLKELDYEVKDHGAFEYNEKDDYPDFIRSAAKAVAENPEIDRAVVLGGSGQGEAMLANRFQGVRAAVFYGKPYSIIKLSREHNNANVLSLGARFLSEEEAKEAAKLWLKTPFSEDVRHQRRIKKIDVKNG